EASVDALKQTILQLAVMGKLVPQDPNDEPASELLKRIAQEKAQLVKEGKIKKQKPLPPISDEEKPFELPEGWEWCRIDDLTFVSGGIQKQPKRRPVKNHFPYLRVANVQRGDINIDKLER
ncbi:restriction endonuclease subunit S, partial [Escherichia coli]|nr:restriction endonuclease subunit S [Escherichia coli]